MDYINAAAYIESWLRKQSSTQAPPFPTDREWARELGVSHNTTNRAIIYLMGKGLLARHGRTILPVSAQESTKIPLLAPPIHYICKAADDSAYVDLVAKLSQAGTCLRIHPNKTAENYRNTAERLREQPSAGIILGPPICQIEPKWAASARKSTYPIVSINSDDSFPYQVTPSQRQQISAALELLHQNGHTRIGGILNPTPAHLKMLEVKSREELWAQCCSNLDLSAEYLCPPLSGTTYYQSETINQYIQQYPEITALVCQPIPILLDILAKTYKVPETLSVVTVGNTLKLDHPELPKLTRVTTPVNHDLLWALRLIEHLNHEIETLGRLPSQCRIWVDSVVWKGNSVRSLDPCSGYKCQSEQGENESTELSIESVLANMTQPYPGLTGQEQWVCIDLTTVANRGIRRYHSWFGHHPLLHLNSGQRSLHGIPFTLINENANHGHCAVVLSRPEMSKYGDPLPERMEIPLGMNQKPLRALAFFHGAGWIQHSSLMARLVLGNSLGESETHLLYAVGMAGPLPPSPAAVISDWWPESYHASTAESQIALIAANDPQLYSRYLYTHLWWLPQNDPRRWDTLSITLEPEETACYGLLALTAMVEEQ